MNTSADSHSALFTLLLMPAVTFLHTYLITSIGFFFLNTSGQNRSELTWRYLGCRKHLCTNLAVNLSPAHPPLYLHQGKIKFWFEGPTMQHLVVPGLRLKFADEKRISVLLCFNSATHGRQHHFYKAADSCQSKQGELDNFRSLGS